MQSDTLYLGNHTEYLIKYEKGVSPCRKKLPQPRSRKGNCYDNAAMESFWGTLKNELVHHRNYKTRHEAIQEISEYIEIFYNRQRIQARLGYLSPAAFEKNYYQQKMAA